MYRYVFPHPSLREQRYFPGKQHGRRMRPWNEHSALVNVAQVLVEKQSLVVLVT